MKGLPCACLCPAHFWQPGSCFMAEDSRTQAPGKGPPLSVQLLRAQYEGLRQQQRAQTQLLVLPKGGNTPAPAEPMVSAVWVNKERTHSLLLDKADADAAGTLEAAERGSLQLPGCAWHTHLRMYRSTQTGHREASYPVKHKAEFTGSEQRPPQERDPVLSENEQTARPETTTPEAAQRECQAGNSHTKAAESRSSNGIPCPSSRKNAHRPGQPAHYPFPQRKTPRISQAARNLGLYGPA